MSEQLTLYQAEWCPFSSAVRELLTELELPFVAIPVEPWPEERQSLRERAGTDQIPVLETADGELHRGTRAIFAYLAAQPGSAHGRDHRRRFVEHRDARETDVVGQLVARAELADPGPPPAGEPQVRHNPDESRYEITIGDRMIGFAAYRRRGDNVVFTHTEIDPSCEGRGYGSLLVAHALADVRRQGLTVVPLCPFVAAYVARHPDEQDVVPARR
jgi:predicted GNAT family acetyltransferase/glutaredoxin